MMLALIPARSGSKGLPRKNVRILGDKPLIAHTIEAAKGACSIDRVIVSTDSDAIAQIALTYGAEVPFLRPNELAEDNSSAIDVYLHAINYFNKKENMNIKRFIVLLPTSPLRTSKDIDNAVDLYAQTGATTLVSMCDAETPPSWYYSIRGNHRIENAGFGEASTISNRQEYGRFYVPNGAIYILDYALLKSTRTYYDESTVAYIMPKERSIDIDTHLDYLIAECLFRMKGE